MSYARIPINCDPFSEQSFKLTLKNGTVNINILLKLRYLDLYGVWLADVINNTTNTTLLFGVPFVCGINLLGQYSYLDIGEAYIVPVTDTGLQHPDNYTLGSKFYLIWGDDT